MDDIPLPLNFGALLFPGFELLDVYGPLEMIGLLGPERATITVLAERPGAVESSKGPKGFADAALSEAPPIDVLLVPGGWGTRREVENPVLLDWIRARSQETRFVTSVCTGSALLARSGVLDGRRATSNKAVFEWVRTQGPRVTWVRQARWVEDGKFVTSSGVSAGMDMTLGLIGHLYGAPAALQVAQLAEYTWQSDKSVDRFA